MRFAVAAFLLGWGLASAPASEAVGIHVALTPALMQVQPDDEFTLDLTVTEPDGAFNAFDAVVEFDPAFLTFVPAVPTSLQEGGLMTGACGATFHRFQAGGDSLLITDVLLCAAQALTGPGQIYRLRFRAGATPGVTFVRLRAPRVKFYNAGLYVVPVTTSDAEVRVGSVTAAGGPGAATGLALRAFPNPSRSGAMLRVSADRAGRQQVSIFDARGRLVRSFAPTEETAGERNLWWDGRDHAGQSVVAGQYSVVVRLGERRARGHITLLH